VRLIEDFHAAVHPFRLVQPPFGRPYPLFVA
jgi:hypothetical protein